MLHLTVAGHQSWENVKGREISAGINNFGIFSFNVDPLFTGCKGNPLFIRKDKTEPEGARSDEHRSDGVICL